MVNIDWMGFSLASVAVVLAPGPGSMFVAKTAASAGPRAGRTAMFGIKETLAWSDYLSSACPHYFMPIRRSLTLPCSCRNLGIESIQNVIRSRLQMFSRGKQEFTAGGLFGVIPEVLIRNPVTLKTTSLDTGWSLPRTAIRGRYDGL